LVEERDGGYYPAEGHEQRFAEYLEQSGCNAAEQRQRDRIERERLAYELHGIGRKIAHEFHDEEQPGFDGEQTGHDSGEWIPELEEPLPEIENSYSEAPEIEGNMPTMPDTEATGAPRTDAAEPSRGDVRSATAEPVHAVMCECDDCIYPVPNWAAPKPYLADSAHPSSQASQAA
jgi:hypothetical protein